MKKASKASPKVQWRPGIEHPAIAVVHNGGTLAAVSTAAGTIPCREGDFIVPDGDGYVVERPDGTRVVPNG